MFSYLSFSAFQCFSFYSINDALDEVSDRRFFIVDEVAGGDAVGGDDDLGMEACAEEIDGDHRCSFGFVLKAERLAKHHLATLERGMRVAAHSVADDKGGDHGVDAEMLKI
jgi:hypothetical protein